MEVKICNSKQEVAGRFSNYFYEFVKNREEVHIALSGGSTPKIVFEELASNFKDKILWDRVHLYWGDERCVPPEDDQSNYKMTMDHLLSRIDIPKSNIHRIKGENEPEVEAVAYAVMLENNLPRRNDLPQFDLVILGMGDDGHTVSIFPHQIGLWYSDRLCEVARHPLTGQQRITITGSVINNSDEVVFLVTGDSKAEKIREIMMEEGEFELYPANLVAPESGSLTWFLDVDAAGQLPIN
ncbi:MAG: 6-phosphogluconolactonase [Flavobacteriaceae bacterium]